MPFRIGKPGSMRTTYLVILKITAISIQCPSATAHSRCIADVHQLAGAGYVAKLGCQIQQSNLVVDDVLLNTTHGVTPSHLCALLDKDLHLYQTG
jgi:hypothetical protein